MPRRKCTPVATSRMAPDPAGRGGGPVARDGTQDAAASARAPFHPASSRLNFAVVVRGPVRRGIQELPRVCFRGIAAGSCPAVRMARDHGAGGPNSSDHHVVAAGLLLADLLGLRREPNVKGWWPMLHGPGGRRHLTGQGWRCPSGLLLPTGTGHRGLHRGQPARTGRARQGHPIVAKRRSRSTLARHDTKVHDEDADQDAHVGAAWTADHQAVWQDTALPGLPPPSPVTSRSPAAMEAATRARA